MSIGSEENKIISQKQWDVNTIYIDKPNANDWGIDRTNLRAALKIIKENNIEANSRSGISFKAFSFLVNYLYSNGYDTSDINRAIGKFSEPDKASEDINENFYRQFQQTIQSLFPSHSPAPYTVYADGKWGPHSQAALKYLAGIYNLPDKDPDHELLSILESVSRRIVRIVCDDRRLLERSSYNPFCIIDNKGESYSLSLKGNGASLVDLTDNRELAHFSSFFATDRRGLNSFNQFSAWLMLLKMGSPKYEKVGQLSFKDMDGRFISLEQLQNTPKENFFIKPDHYINFRDFQAKTDVLFSSPTEEQIDILGIYFSGEFKFTIVRGNLYDGPETGNGKIKTFDAGSFYRSYEYLENKNQYAYPLYKADYLKIFIVKKGFWDNVSNEITYQGFPEVDAGSDFYKLITANEADIYADYTLGLIFNEEPVAKAAAFNYKWILVTGTGNSKFSKKERMVSEIAGELLAARGYGVICGGWPGVDEVVSYSFTEFLKKNNISEKERLIQLLDQDQKPVYDYGKIETTGAGSDWYMEALNRSIAMIMIGGQGGTYEAYEQAAKRSIPVIPIAGTGGDAKKAFDKMLKERKILVTYESAHKFGRIINSHGDAKKSIDAVIEILDQLNFVGPAIPEEEFKLNVEKMYAEKKITVADDLQKDRWGGSNERNKKMFTAQVSKEKKGLFKVALEVRSTDPGIQLTGNVAFFCS